MTKEQYIKFHEDFCKEMTEITRKKNHDYSGGGDDPFRNFRQIENLVGRLPTRTIGGPMPVEVAIDVTAIGFLTRMSDKFSRIGSFIAKGELLVKDETVTDSLCDLANYCALFAGYLQEKSDEQRKATSKTNV